MLGSQSYAKPADGAVYDPRDFIDEKLHAVASYLSSREKGGIPGHVQSVLDSVHIAESADSFRVQNVYHQAMVSQAKARLEKEMLPSGERRKYELRLAAMIQRDVVPRYKGIDKTLVDLPEKLRNCRDHGMVGLAPNGDVKYHWPHKCNQVKLCAHEARHETLRLAERYLQPLLGYLLDHQRSKLQYHVISPMNCKIGELSETKRKLSQAYSKLNRRAVTKNVVASIVVQEDPLGRGDDNWNVHLNVMAVIDGHFSWTEYRRAFADELGHDDVQIEFIDEREMRRRTTRKLRKQAHAAGEAVALPGRMEVIQNAFLELVKYVTKIAGIDHANRNDDEKLNEARPMDQWPGSLWFEWWMANKGFRRTRSYGELYRVCDTCGSYHHTAKKCEQEPEPEPSAEWIGFKYWDDLLAAYALSIDLIPADKFTADGPNFDSYHRHQTGPPGGYYP